jgi:CBS domain-containing membrane protein
MGADEEAETMTLGLDTSEVGSGAEPGRVRVYLAVASSFLKESGEPTLAPACQSYSVLSQEIDRLVEELEALRQQGGTWFGVEQDHPASKPAREDEPNDRPTTTTGASLLVADVMTREVATLESNQQLSVAEDLMQQRRIRHLPVLNDERDLVGIVSQRDLFFGALSWSMGQGRRAQEKALETFPLKQVMRTDVVTIDPDKPLSEAARLMTEHKVGCLPVLRAGRLVGILTEGDFVALCVREQAGSA